MIKKWRTVGEKSQRENKKNTLHQLSLSPTFEPNWCLSKSVRNFAKEKLSPQKQRLHSNAMLLSSFFACVILPQSAPKETPVKCTSCLDFLLCGDKRFQSVLFPSHEAAAATSALRHALRIEPIQFHFTVPSHWNLAPISARLLIGGCPQNASAPEPEPHSTRAHKKNQIHWTSHPFLLVCMHVALEIARTSSRRRSLQVSNLEQGLIARKN